MATGLLLCLLVFFISSAETRNVPYKIETYDCKALYKFNSSVIGAIFQNLTYGIAKSFSAEKLPALITIPSNSTVRLSIRILTSTNSDQTAGIQKSPATCCSDKAAIYKNCHTLTLICPEKCGSPKWPELQGLYKESDCDSCICQYCYNGNGTRRQQIVVRTDSHSHLFDEEFLPVQKIQTKIIKPRKTLLNPFKLPPMPNTELLPQDRLARRYFTIGRGKDGFYLSPKPSETLPENGRMQFYMEKINKNTTFISMVEYDIKWYSPLKCSIEMLKVVYLNYPILVINCINEIQESINYIVDNSNFQLLENTLYLRELTTHGNHNITISAMYGSREDSRFTAKLQLNLSAASPLLTLNGCQADINFEVLNYTEAHIGTRSAFSFVILHDRPSSYVIDLRANKTNSLLIDIIGKPPTFTITATTPETCCYGTVHIPETELCFDLDLTCPKSCEVIEWQEQTDFQKIPGNGSCSSLYCYTGFEIGRHQLSARLKRSTYKFQVRITQLHSINQTLIRERKRFLKPIEFNLTTSYHFNESLHFEIESVNYTNFLRLKDEANFPLNGRVRLYFYLSKYKRRDLDVIWYTPSKCKSSALQAKYLNDPLLEINCEHSLWLPVEYLSSSGIFEMRNNLLYQRDLTASIPTTFTISAVYASEEVGIVRFRDFEPTVPANYSLLTVHRCQAVFNFTLLNYTKMTISNLKTKHNLTDKPEFYIIDLPPNTTTTFELFLDDQIKPYTITATSPEVCCNHTYITRNGICHNLTMSSMCKVSSWPEYTNFYKASGCHNNSCTYCYVGNKTTSYKIELPLDLSTYILTINVRRVLKYTYEVNKPRKEFLTSLQQLRSQYGSTLPNPPNDLLQRYFEIVAFRGGFFRLQPKNEEILPTSGQFLFSRASPIPYIYEYKMKWSSPIDCKFQTFLGEYRNSALLGLDCENTKNETIVYNISDPNFEVINNYVYLKNLTMNGPFNFSITAMYEGLDRSATTVDVIHKGLKYTDPLLIVRNCTAMFDFQSLQFDRIDLHSKELGLNEIISSPFFTIPLPKNKTITFKIRVNRGHWNSLDAVSSETCCQESVSTFIAGLCFELKLICPGTCRVTDWPDYAEFYKASECKDCTCKYVYIGNTGGTKIITMTSTDYEWKLPTAIFARSKNKVTIPRNKLQTLEIDTYLSSPYKLPDPWNRVPNNHFFQLNNSTVSIDVRKHTMLPLNGRVPLYVFGHDKGTGHPILKGYQITWFSPLKCNISRHEHKYLNSPLFSVDCQNTLQRPIIYSHSSSIFEMKSNHVYLKDFMRNGTYNLSIIAMYEGLKESAITVNISEGPYFIPPLLEVNECTVVFNFQLLNFSRLHLTSQQLGLNINSTDKQAMEINIPQNRTITFGIRLDVGPLYMLKAVSSGICCKEVISGRPGSCFELSFTCGDACGVSNWPNAENLYKSSECKGCNCSYCYIGDAAVTQTLSVIEKSHTYSWNVTLLIFGKEKRDYLLPRQRIFPTFTLGQYLREPGNKTCTGVAHNSIELSLRLKDPELYICLDDHVILPFPWGSFLHRYYDYEKNSRTLTIKPEKDKLIKRNGQFTFFTVHERDFILQEYNVTWYSPLLCVASNLFEKRINDPLLSIDCENEMNRKILYKVSHHYFRMENNFVYLKYSNTEGHFNFSITAMYEGLVNSSTTVNVSVEVSEIFITELNATKDRKNQYTFTCYTNSTFKDLIYEWYWSGSKVTGGGLSSSMQNGKSFGRFVFDGLGDKESGYLNCTAKRKGVHGMAITNKYINTDEFPVVKWNTTSDVIKNGIPVNVTCHLLPKNKNSKVFLMVNNQLMEKSNVSLTKEANLSCYGVNHVGRGENTTLRIYVATGKRTCPAVKSGGIKWSETIADTKVSAPCIGKFSGIVSRSCSKDGKWGVPDNSTCVKKSIVDAKSSLNRIAIIGGDIGTTMEDFANATKQDLTPEDMSETIDALNIASDITKKRKQVSVKEVQGFVDIVSNLVGDDSEAKWETLQEKNNLTAASMLNITENFGTIAAQKINKTIVIISKNLVLELRNVDVNENIQFSAADSKQPEWVEKGNTGVFVPSQIIKDAFGANESVTMTAALFKNMGKLLPKSSKSNDSVNSNIISISFGRQLENLTENITLNFPHLQKVRKEASCNFWDFKKDPEVGGSWSTDGCVVQATNSTYTTCSCNHLTNFAILMKVGKYEVSKNLSIISTIGCSISIFSLVVTAIVYAICWKYVTSQDVTRSQSILLMNLCASLLIGYVLFLTLVERTSKGNVVCTLIAALIHYFFLVVFFTMLAEGIDMAIALTVVFTSKLNRLPWLIGLSWGAPAVIVAISLAATKTKGFGDEHFCWLTTKNNVNLAFIVPVLVIILANIICTILIVKALLSAYCMLRESIKQRLRTGARAIGILTPLLGFTWIFGIFAVNEDLVAFEYIFAIANSLQGFFIFLAYCVFNKQIRKNLWKKGKPSSQTPAKPSTGSTAIKSTEQSSSNISKRNSSSDDYLRDSSDTRQSNIYSNVYETLNTEALRHSNGLDKPIAPYYMRAKLDTSLNTSLKNNQI